MSGVLWHGRRRLELWKKWRDAIVSEGVNLTAWEEEFMENIGERLDQDRMLSDMQAETLESIYANRTP